MFDVFVFILYLTYFVILFDVFLLDVITYFVYFNLYLQRENYVAQLLMNFLSAEIYRKGPLGHVIQMCCFWLWFRKRPKGID